MKLSSTPRTLPLCLVLVACGGGKSQTGGAAGAPGDGAAGAGVPDGSAGTIVLDGGGTAGAGSGLLDAAPTIEAGGEPLDPASEKWLLEGPAAPVALTLELDTTRAASGSIDAKGGKVAATAADGTRFELTIPPGAVFNSTPIKMTPAKVTAGLPAALSDAHLVHLEPEGLSLEKLASLRVVAAQPAPLAETVPLGFRGAGEGLFLTYLGAQAEPTVSLDHFSGYGVARGAILDSPDFTRQLGARAEDRFRTQMAYERLKARRFEPGNPDLYPPPAKTDPFYKSYLEAFVFPKITNANAEVCGRARDVIDLILHALHDGYELGFPAKYGPNEASKPFLKPFVLAMARACMKEEFDACQPPKRVYHVILPMWRQLRAEVALFVEPNIPDFDHLDTYAEGLIDACLQFTLRFESQVTFTEKGGGGYDAKVVLSPLTIAPVPLNFEGGEGMLQGHAPLNPVSFTFTATDCTAKTDPGAPVTFEVLDLDFAADYTMFRDRGFVKDMGLTYFPGLTSQRYTLTCKDAGTLPEMSQPLWTSSFIDAHMTEFDDQGAVFHAAGFQCSPQNPVGEMGWTGLIGAEGSKDTGFFRLEHTPKAAPP